MQDHRPDSPEIDYRHYHSLGLAGCWPIGKSYPLKDITGRGRQFSLTAQGGTAPSLVAGPEGGLSLDFSANTGGGAGVGGVCPLAQTLSLGTEWTLAAWICPSASPDGMVFSGANVSAGNNQLYISGTTWYYQNSGNSSATAGTLTLGQWYHVCVTRAGSRIRFYLDGKQVGSDLTTAGGSDSLTSVGGRYPYNGYLFAGKVFDVRASLTEFSPAMVWNLVNLPARGALYLPNGVAGKIPGTTHLLVATVDGLSSASGAITRTFSVSTTVDGLSSASAPLSRLFSVVATVDGISTTNDAPLSRTIGLAASLAPTSSVVDSATTLTYAMTAEVIGVPQIAGILTVASTLPPEGLGRIFLAPKRLTAVKAPRRALIIKAPTRKNAVVFGKRHGGNVSRKV